MTVQIPRKSAFEHFINLLFDISYCDWMCLIGIDKNKLFWVEQQFECHNSCNQLSNKENSFHLKIKIGDGRTVSTIVI